jgi:predicted Zn-dependent peptidase
MNSRDFTQIKLKNGLKALIYPQKHVNSISIIAMVRAGQLSETIKENGIAHLLEHMIFDGTEKFPSFRKLTKFYDQIAGAFSGVTSTEVITIGGTFVDEEIENALICLDQLLFHPLLDERFLQTEKSIILDELATYEDTPSYRHLLRAKEVRFTGDTILKLPLGGTKKSLQAISLEMVKDYHKRLFRPDNIRLVIAGKCDPLKIKDLLENIFSYTQRKEELKHQTFSYDQFSNDIIDISSFPTKKSYIKITFPSFSWKSKTKDRIALSFLCSLFANRRDSLLYSYLREKMGWIYDIGAEFVVGFDIGALEINTSTPLDKSLDVVNEILKKIHHIKTTTFPKNKLEILKEIDRKRMKMAFDTTRGIVDWFAEEFFYRYPKIILPKDLLKFYDQIDTDYLQKIAQEVMDFEKMNICIMQPFRWAEKLKYTAKIKKFVKEFNS